MSGAEIWSAQYNNFTNTIIRNNTDGFYLKDGAVGNIIRDSNISNNLNYGIYVQNSNGNYIYNNIFSGNLVENYGFIGTGINNWNNSVSGNYWLNLNNTGFSQTCLDQSPVDGICDTNFTLFSNNTDYLPLYLVPVLDYTFPTPQDRAKISKSEVTIEFNDEDLVIYGCNVTIDSVIYVMNYSNGVCTYTFNGFDVFKRNYVFNVSYTHFGGTEFMATRSFYFYPTRELLSEVPVLSLSSFLIIFILVVFSLV